MKTQKNPGEMVALVFKAVGLAMAVAVIVLNALGTVAIETSVTLLGIGLFGVAVAALDKEAS